MTEAEIKAAIYFAANGDDLRVIYNIPGEAAATCNATERVWRLGHERQR